MTTTVKSADRYPRPAIEQAITAALENTDYTTEAQWSRPEACRCVREGVSCLDVQARAHALPGGVTECQGHVIAVPVAPGRSLTPDDLITALPAPDDSGMVSGAETAAALFAVCTDRLSWSPVWPDSLAQRLEKAFGELEDTLQPDSRVPASAVPVSVLVCQWCSGPIPLARGPKARFCRNSHRVSAHRAKKRRQERAANAAPAGSR